MLFPTLDFGLFFLPVLVLVWTVGMHLCRQAETSMDHLHLRAVVDVVHEVHQFVVCRRHDQDVDLAVLVWTCLVRMKMDCYQVLPSDEEFPCPAPMRMDCCQVLEFQLVDFVQGQELQQVFPA